MSKDKGKKKSGKPEKSKKVKADKVDPHIAHLQRVRELDKIVGSKKSSKKEVKAAKAELAQLREASEARKAEGDEQMWEKVREDKKTKAEAAAEKKIEVEAVPEFENSPEVEEDVATIKARVEQKRKDREYGLSLWDHVDRADAPAVALWNKTYAELTGRSMTSEDEVKDRTDALGLDNLKTLMLEPGEPTPEKKPGKKKKLSAKELVESEAEKSEPDAPAESEPPTVVVDGDKEYLLDPAQGVGVNGHGRPMIWDPEQEKLVPHTRMTTFIDVLDDKTQLDKWKQRTVLAGAAILDVQGKEDPEVIPIIQRSVDAALTFEQIVKKLDKSDRKNQLSDGEYAATFDAAEKAYKRELDALASEALEVGGAHVKADHGTELHRLTQVYDELGMEALLAENPSPADLRDVVAYTEAMEAIGITKKEVLAVEQRVVLRDRKVTGTFDRGLRYKPLLRDANGKPTGERATRSAKVVGDLKTGRVDYGAGKINMQIAGYALGEGYDPESHEFTKLGYSTKVGLLIHLPAGTGTCTIWEVDLSKGIEGLKLADLVRAWRQTTTEAQAYRGKNPFYTLAYEKAEPDPTA